MRTKAGNGTDESESKNGALEWEEEIDEGSNEGIQAVTAKIDEGSDEAVGEEVIEEHNADTYKNQSDEMNERNVRGTNMLQGRIRKKPE